MTHPTNELDETVHQRARLGILAVLVPARRVEFGHLKDVLNLTDGNLSRHVSVLEAAGYVQVEKGFVGKRPRTWISITRDGRAAFDREIDALRDLVAAIDVAPRKKP